MTLHLLFSKWIGVDDMGLLTKKKKKNRAWARPLWLGTRPGLRGPVALDLIFFKIFLIKTFLYMFFLILSLYFISL
jgi:hypothetical protein